MLSSQEIDQAARHLVAARKSKTPGASIPANVRPTDTDSAMAIQERV